MEREYYFCEETKLLLLLWTKRHFDKTLGKNRKWKLQEVTTGKFLYYRPEAARKYLKKSTAAKVLYGPK